VEANLILERSIPVSRIHHVHGTQQRPANLSTQIHNDQHSVTAAICVPLSQCWHAVYMVSWAGGG